jgi:L-malate glycosyltransferase
VKIGIISIIHEPWGGSEELWAAMAQEALDAGHEVMYCSYHFQQQHPKLLALQQKGLQLTPRLAYVPGSADGFERKWKKAWYWLLHKVLSPYKKLFSVQPDVLFYNGTSLSILQDGPLQKLWQSFGGKKVILAHYLPEHNAVLTFASRKGLQDFYRASDLSLFVSHRTAEVTRRTIALPQLSYSLMRNPVNMPDTSFVEWPAQNDILQLAMVGNLIAVHKGQDIMLQLLGNDAWKQKAWHLNIYGEGMDKEYLQSLAQMYGIADKVTFHGRVNDIRHLWSHNHLLLMPSVMEGMPLVVAEAMLCGRPVVATDVGGHAEWIDDNVNGFLAAASTVNALQEALIRAWERRADWESIGKLAHEKAMQLYDPSPGKTLLHLLEQVAGKKG